MSETETIKEGLERQVSEIIQKHRSAMYNELKPYYAQLARIAALEKPKPIFIPKELIDVMSDEQKEEVSKLIGGVN